MADLRALVEGLGYAEVRTYLQTGNMAARCRATEARDRRGEARGGVGGVRPEERRRDGADPRASWKKLVRAQPFAGYDAEAHYRHVLFTKTAVEPPTRADGDQGRHLPALGAACVARRLCEGREVGERERRGRVALEGAGNRAVVERRRGLHARRRRPIAQSARRAGQVRPLQPGPTLGSAQATIRAMPEHRLTTLPGGERVISEHIDGVRSVALGLWIGAGSRDEPRAKAGVSHFIEHLLFKGSSRYSAQEIAELFDAMGGELNAATSRETTVVYTRVPDDHLEQALDAMIDMVFEPSFADLDSEREVVLEEIAMVEDNPQDLVHDIAAEVVFGTHPLGRPVIGRAEVISSVSRRALRGYHGGAYVGGNVVLAAAGNVDHERLVELLAAAPRDDAAAPLRLVAAAGAARPRARACASCARTPSSTTSCLSGPGVSRADDRRYAASLLDAIVGGSASSRLFQEIREKRGMAYSVYSYGSQFAETGQVGVYVGTRADNLAECLEVAAARAARRRRGQPPRGRAGAGEGEPERPAAAVARVDLEPDDAARPRGDHRRRDRVRGGDDRPHRGGHGRRRGRARARELLAPEALSAAGIGPSEKRFRDAVARFNPAARAA